MRRWTIEQVKAVAFLAGLLVAALAVAYLVLWRYAEQQSCEDDGGTYVQTMGGYECVGDE
jgi:hypothetical protein